MSQALFGGSDLQNASHELEHDAYWRDIYYPPFATTHTTREDARQTRMIRKYLAAFASSSLRCEELRDCVRANFLRE